MTTPNESLRPCPFCGKEAHHSPTGFVFFTCGCVKDCCEDTDMNLSAASWNNAYAWQEVDRLKEEISRSAATLDKAKAALVAADSMVSHHYIECDYVTDECPVILAYRTLRKEVGI